MGLSLGLKLHGAAQAIDALDDMRDALGDDAYSVGTSVEYAAYVEFGTSTQQAQPYLFPAAQKVMRSQFDAFARAANSTDELARMVALAIEAEAKRTVPVDTGRLRASISVQKIN